jgi:allophanate hydrolase subunit 2
VNTDAEGLWVTHPGISATIQDSGRSGYRQHGLAVGGALDLHAFNWANKLLANPPGSACLEIMLGDFRATAELNMTIAVTGAYAPITVNGTPTGKWQTLALKAGDELAINHAESGRILYLALPGGTGGVDGASAELISTWAATDSFSRSRPSSTCSVPM